MDSSETLKLEIDLIKKEVKDLKELASVCILRMTLISILNADISRLLIEALVDWEDNQENAYANLRKSLGLNEEILTEIGKLRARFEHL